MFGSVKQTLKIIALLLAIALIVVGCANAASESQTVAESAPTATTAPAVEAVVPPTDTPAAEAVATEAPQEENRASSDGQIAAQSRTFMIDSAQSQARFNIFEELRGAPKTVEGVTTIEGSVVFDPNDLTTASISEIVIDARSFKTDSTMRDGAIRRFILGSNSDDYRYIIFTPTAISGLPASSAVGETLNFEVTGDLRIYETVKPVTFAMTVKANSETELVGSGTTTVTRSDFGLTIPSVPGVANVADEVPLFIDFVAKSE